MKIMKVRLPAKEKKPQYISSDRFHKTKNKKRPDEDSSILLSEDASSQKHSKIESLTDNVEKFKEKIRKKLSKVDEKEY